MTSTRGNGAPPMAPNRGRLLALLLGLLTVFLVAEVALRLTSRVYWRSELATSGVQYDVPPEATSCADCTKILVVGDSFTFGFGAATGNDYPHQLQRLLDEKHPGAFVVVNAGMAAANSTMIRDILADYLQRIDAHVVLVLAGGSNALNLYQYYAFAWGDPRWAVAERTLYRIRVLRFLRFAWARFASPQNPSRWQHDLLRLVWPQTLAAGQRYWERSENVPASLPAAFQEVMGLMEEDDARAAQGGASGNEQRAAAEALQTLARQHPQDPVLQDALGQTWFKMRRNDEANKAFRAGLAADPGYAGNYCGLGNLNAAEERYTAAVTQLHNGIVRDPDDLRCYPALVAIARLLGLQGATADFLTDNAAGSQVALRHAALLAEESHQSTAWMREDLQNMVDQAQNAGARVVLQAYPNQNEANAILRSVAQANQLLLVDHLGRFSAYREAHPNVDLFIPDGHCNDAGYGVMAQNILTVLEEGELISDR